MAKTSSAAASENYFFAVGLARYHASIAEIDGKWVDSPPVDRPNLSKDYLAGTAQERIGFLKIGFSRLWCLCHDWVPKPTWPVHLTEDPSGYRIDSSANTPRNCASFKHRGSLRFPRVAQPRL